MRHERRKDGWWLGGDTCHVATQTLPLHLRCISISNKSSLILARWGLIIIPPPWEKKRALQGLTLQVCKRVWRSVDELQDILGQDRPKCWIFRHLYNHDVLITLPGCQTQSCSFDRDNSSKTKTKTPWPKTETKTSKNCLKAVLRQDTVSKLNITGKVPPNTRSKPSTWLNLLKLLVFLIRVRRSCAVSTIKLMYVPKN